MSQRWLGNINRCGSEESWVLKSPEFFLWKQEKKEDTVQASLQLFEVVWSCSFFFFSFSSIHISSLPFFYFPISSSYIPSRSSARVPKGTHNPVCKLNYLMIYLLTICLQQSVFASCASPWLYNKITAAVCEWAVTLHRSGALQEASVRKWKMWEEEAQQGLNIRANMTNH